MNAHITVLTNQLALEVGRLDAPYVTRLRTASPSLVDRWVERARSTHRSRGAPTIAELAPLP